MRAIARTIWELTRRRRVLAKVSATVMGRWRREAQKHALGDADPAMFTANWLVQLERRFASGRVCVPLAGPQDGLTFANMYGADRMALDLNAYAHDYEQVLQSINTSQIQHVVEIGILNGSGLACWSVIFSGAHITGIDINLELCESNLHTHAERGAFQHGLPLLIETDATSPDTADLERVLKPLPRIDFVVDDGPHTHRAIETMGRALLPFLNASFTYVIEDNPGALRVARRVFKNANRIQQIGGLVVISSDGDPAL